MKIVCLADTQEKPAILKLYLEVAKPLLKEADLIVHLGDGIVLARPLLEQYSNVIYVKGNHDPTCDPALHEYKFQGISLLFIHGEGNPWIEQPNIWLNKLRDKFGLPPELGAYYKRLYKKYLGRAEVIVYGHTHIPKLETVDKSIFFCPGGLPPKRLLFNVRPALGEIMIGPSENKLTLEFTVYTINTDTKQLNVLWQSQRFLFGN